VARRSSVASRAAQRQRELQRVAREQERARLASARAAEQARKASERAQALDEKERKRLYLEARTAEVTALNEALVVSNETLEGLLHAALEVDDPLGIQSLKAAPEIPPFQPGVLAAPEAEPDRNRFMPVPPSGVAKFMPGAAKKQARAVAEAEERYETELAAYRDRENQRSQALEKARLDYASDVSNINAIAEAQNREVDEFSAAFDAGDPDAIVQFFSMVLDRSAYPDGFPRTHRMAFVPESKQLVVELELPSIEVVPKIKQYRYVKARDAVEESARPQTQVKGLYASLVAQVTLRSVHELFQSDRTAKLETLVLNGYVDTIDPATGKPISPHLITVRVSRDAFTQINLRNVDPAACLKGLNASVSKSPAELVPVRPVLEFDMVDPRFVQESDVLGILDTRPNLMELSPSEFESLITNLFEKMGLDTRQTQPSRDGGVDCVAYDPRPIFGGKVVIQAKRYRHTVGVSAVRDLYGTMQNEGASKGILVTTSGYGKSSFEFAAGKPLELLSGTHLLYLLAENAGIEARIEPPNDWVDPAGDVATDEAQVGSRPVAAEGELPPAPVLRVVGGTSTES
jgi:restriction system protein